jgi:L-threonylcarbamoyladenylate synthase
MAIHYAPRTPTFRIERDQIPSAPIEGIFRPLILGDLPERLFYWPQSLSLNPLYLLTEPRIASASLYDRLHHLDGLGLDFILIIPPPDEPRWSAVRDRVWRASRPWPQD